MNHAKATNDISARQSGELNFKVESTGIVSADVGVWIFTVGASKTSVQTTDVTFTYEPDSTKSDALDGIVASYNAHELQERITKAIEASANAAKTVPAIGDAKFRSLTIALDYQVSYSANAGVKIPWVITFEPKVERSRAMTHSIKLTFKPADAAQSGSPSPLGSLSATPAQP